MKWYKELGYIIYKCAIGLGMFVTALGAVYVFHQMASLIGAIVAAIIFSYMLGDIMYNAQ